MKEGLLPRQQPTSARPAPALDAVIFDVDGTLVDSERDGHRIAFNAAFEEFGLPDRWEVEEYGCLLAITGGERRLREYLRQRGFGDEESADLAHRLHVRKTELFTSMVERGRVPPRPGATRLISDLERRGIRLAVATTGSRAWVVALLDRLFGRGRFEVVVTGDEAPLRKPDPSAYHLALHSLGVDAAGVVAVEDSGNGLAAARAAGLCCVVVLNDYTRDDDVDGAALVVDGFGEPEAGAQVLANPGAIEWHGMLDAATLDRLHGTWVTHRGHAR